MDNKEDNVKAAQNDDEKRLQELLNQPLSKDEANKALAENDINRMQMTVLRQKLTTQVKQLELNIAGLDEQVLTLDMERAVIFRRMLNLDTSKGEK